MNPIRIEPRVLRPVPPIRPVHIEPIPPLRTPAQKPAPRRQPPPRTQLGLDLEAA